MDNIYESNKLVSEYLLFHYGKESEILPYDFGPNQAVGFAEKVVHQSLKLCDLDERSRALDLGAAVGRSTFELSKYFNEVIGIDYSHNFIKAADKIKQNEFIEYSYLDEGNTYIKTRAQKPEGSNKDNIKFLQGDAENLNKTLGKFDLILMANLIDRLKNPKSCLENIKNFFNDNGILIIASPYTWLEEFTRKNNWLSKEDKKTIDSIQNILEDNFKLLNKYNLPFLIREHSRKFQWSVSEVSIWMKF